MAQIFVSAVAHFFMSVAGSKIHERLAHFFIDIYKQAAGTNLDTIVSHSIFKRRHTIHLDERSVSGIIKQTEGDVCKAAFYIAHLESNEINVEDLERFLIHLFTDNPDMLLNNSKGIATNIRRLIRIYDYMKYFISH